ncbi:hypothetical protein B9Z55_011402 [Caenorhabditis nigoni]|uniref:Serpentine receptor class gamma n=1 Tax=Caenorhabditis nigoni TaxID=1611254 RepID=A0A2G5UK74_9PELO|nr:hypothetical protein B9Z55_011402 [Caenorhabditis nigoni]
MSSSLFTHGNNSTSALVSVKNVEYAFDFRQILLPIYLLYTIPSFIAYHKCRKFLSHSSSYFNVIFTNDFCINVALFIIDLLFTRLPISGLLVDLPSLVPEGPILTAIFFLSYYLIYANFYSITLICLNRMSSVVFPYSSNAVGFSRPRFFIEHTCFQFWQQFHVPAIGLIYILPLLTTWQMWTYQPYFLPLYEYRSSYQLVYRPTILLGFLPRNSTSLCFISILLSVVCVFANFATILKYKKTIQSLVAQNEFHRKRTRRVELAMFSIALTVCLSLVLQAVLQALIMVFTGSSTLIRATCQDLRAFALDIAICCPPWILYYTTVHSHKTTISTSSAVHSGAGVPAKTLVMT